MSSDTFTSFFYGTLMHPKILKRVIANDGSHLSICPAVLLDYTRHNVKYAEYPGVVPYSRGKVLFDRELTQEERSVRGTLVRGLTKSDMAALDLFEGDQYYRRPVSAHPLESFFALADSGAIDRLLVPSSPAPLPAELAPAVQAEVYIYADVTELEAKLWSFSDFVRDSAWRWHGAAADTNEEITVVDERRANGTMAIIEGF